MRQQPFASPGEALEHHGVKGMRWGHRKTETIVENGQTKQVTARQAKKADKKWKKAVDSFGFDDEKFTKEYNAKWENHDFSKEDWDNPSPTYRKYTDGYFNEMGKAYASQLTDHFGSSPTGKLEVHHVPGTDQVKIRRKDTVQHADEELATFRIKRSKNGLIVGVEQIVDSMAQSDKLIALGAEYLKHYGVKGMRWGVRKQEETSGEGKAGFIDPVSATYIALFLATVAVSVRDLRRLKKDGGEHHQKKNKDVAWKKKDDLAKPAPPMDVDKLFDTVVKPTNPNYPKSGTKMNCRRCTFTYEMRRRGYDVKATPSYYATGQDTDGVKSATMTKGQKYESIWGQKQIATPHEIAQATPERRSEMIFNEIGKNPNGARGELGVAWKFGGGHSMAWEVVNNKPVVFDTQTREVYRSPTDFKKFSGIISDAAHTRTDNAKLDEQFLRKWAVNHA